MNLSHSFPLAVRSIFMLGLLVFVSALLFRFSLARSVLIELDAVFPWLFTAGVLLWIGRGPRLPTLSVATFARSWLASGWAVMLFVVCAAVLSTPFLVWLGAKTYFNTLGGLLPWNDAVQYLKGIMHLSEFGALTEWTQRRPLSVAWLSFLDMLSGSDLPLLLLLQAGVLGIACSIATLSIARHLGMAEACVFFVSFMVLARPFTPIINSENLGMLWACLAFSALIYAAFQRRFLFLAAGMLLLTLAVRARSGLITLHPMLLLWAGWWFRDVGRRWSWSAVGIALSAMLVGVGVDMLTTLIFGDPRALATGNSAYVFYGLAHGGVGWQSAFGDYPEILNMSELDRLAFVRDKAWAQFIAHPLVLFVGLGKNCLIQPVELWFRSLDAVGLVQYGPHFHDQLKFREGSWEGVSLWSRIVGAALLIGFGSWRGALAFWRHHRTLAPLSWLLIFGLVGVFASVPVVFQDVDSLRILALGFPWLALMVTVAVIGLKRHWQPQPWQGGLTEETTHRLMLVGIVMGVMVAGLAVIGSAMAHWHRQSWARLAPITDCPAGARAMQLFLGPRTPWLWVDHTLPSGAGFSPHLAPDRVYYANYMTGRNERIDLPSSGALIFGLDRLSRELVWLYVPMRLIPQERDYVNLCARIDTESPNLSWGRLYHFVEKPQ